LDHPLITLLNWVVGASTPLLAGFIGGVISQAVVLLATRGKSDVPMRLRVQIVLIWLMLLGLLLINVNQGKNIQQLLTGAN
jgi:multisubunit Na+/H+ antiporter MnhE subunit